MSTLDRLTEIRIRLNQRADHPESSCEDETCEMHYTPLWGAETVGWLVQEVERLHQAGRTIEAHSVIRPADGYERIVYDALNVFGEAR
jgi:hypothetical protein